MSGGVLALPVLTWPLHFEQFVVSQRRFNYSGAQSLTGSFVLPTVLAQRANLLYVSPQTQAPSSELNLSHLRPAANAKG